VAIDTPVFEQKKILKKYGQEKSKLVYDLANQGSELYSLRYDLTVPFARYLAANRIEMIKRYQIGKVYRRDQPVTTKGVRVTTKGRISARLREFYQCDFDIAGQGELMVQDSECLKVIEEVISALDLGNFEIRINHRLLLEGILKESGICSDHFKTVCSSINKLDTNTWKEVHEELVNEKGVDVESADKLGELIRIREKLDTADNIALLDWYAENKWIKNENNKGYTEILTAVDELRELMECAKIFGCSEKRLLFYPSLAPNFEYYTGTFYEVVMNRVSPSEVTSKQPKNVISIAAGGRYDNLVGKFIEIRRKNTKHGVPCVGVSFGIDRICTILEKKNKSTQTRPNLCVSPTDVYIASIRESDTEMVKKRMKLCSLLWNAGIPTELCDRTNQKSIDEIREQNIVPLMIIFDGELPENCVMLINDQRREEIIKIDELVTKINDELATKVN